MTVSSWVYERANVADDGQIIAKSNGSAGWQLKSTPDTGPRTFAIKITDPSGASVHRYSTTVRALNTWYHVAGVYDSAARTLNIYVNGALANGTLSAPVPASQSDAPVNVNIGRRTGGFYIDGVVDDVRVYNRALSLGEIQADMAAAINGGGTPDTTPPSAPASLTATAVSSSQINLSWPASTDDVGVTGYKVLRGGFQIATTAAPSFSDTGLSPSTTYTYAVTAIDQAGNTSAPSPTASATTPSIPFDFALSNDGNKSVAQGASTTAVVTAAPAARRTSTTSLNGLAWRPSSSGS
jgi:chitodextrinase